MYFEESRSEGSGCGLGGSQLRSLRIATGFTQEQLSDRSGVHVRTIRGLESGRIARPRRSTVDALSTAMSLDISVRGALLADWKIYDADPADSTQPRTGRSQLDAIETHLAASRRSLKNVAVIEYVTVGADRRLAHRETQEVFIARRAGVSTSAIYWDPMDDSIDVTRFRLENVEGCTVIDEIPDPSGTGKLFRMKLRRTLDAGETHINRYRLDFARARRPGPHEMPTEGAEITGFYHSPALFILELRFDSDDLPISCEQIYQARPNATIRPTQTISVNAAGVCHIALERPRPGGHGISWHW